VQKLPIIYVRGYAGATATINNQVDDPFYGFNKGATHVRVNGDGDPMYYQFEGPMLRLITDDDYELLVHGDQHVFLTEAKAGEVPQASIWVYRFYDQAATTFVAPPHRSLVEHFFDKLHHSVSADGFDIETAAAGLYDLILLIREKTGADKVHLVAHSMGGLVARCLIQKICQGKDAGGNDRLPARDIVAKLFTYGTPHGGISFEISALNWAQEAFGPAGADIFAPEKMYGYLTPGARFGDTAQDPGSWDPQRVPEKVFSTDDIFCLVGTDPQDYGAPKLVVGPRSDGLVRIEHAYIRGANRAYVHKSHSGSYGEVNSEEGYQNLRRFLFGRWRVQVDFDRLPRGASGNGHDVWQADMRLAVRGLSVVMSEQIAAHWCPIQLNDELARPFDSVDTPVPLVATFLLDPAQQLPEAQNRHEGRARYSLTLRVFKVPERDGLFSFRDHLEQVPDWADTLVVDVAPTADGTGLQAWMAWNSQVDGALEDFDPITEGVRGASGDAVAFERNGDVLTNRIDLPATAQALPVLGKSAGLVISVRERAGAGADDAPVTAAR
jgi:pimeloyl-ACP methyl ester carboxylesterase